MVRRSLREKRIRILLVFGDIPDETLAKQLLVSVSPAYLLDFDDDVPVTLKLDRKKARVIETRVNEHPADFLEQRGIVAPGYEFAPPPVKDVGLIEEVSLAQAKRALSSEFEVELREHPRGVLVIDGPVGVMLARELGKSAYCVYYNPEDGWFSCVAYERGQEQGAYSPVFPDANALPLDNILGETTLDGILRILVIPRELLGVRPTPEGRRDMVPMRRNDEVALLDRRARGCRRARRAGRCRRAGFGDHHAGSPIPASGLRWCSRSWRELSCTLSIQSRASLSPTACIPLSASRPHQSRMLRWPRASPAAGRTA